MNCLIGSQRMLTGPEAGLTRDANTSVLTQDGHKILLTDTAGYLQHGRLEKADAFGCARLQLLEPERPPQLTAVLCEQRRSGWRRQQAD